MTWCWPVANLRYRVGEYRVIYRVDDQKISVIVVDIAHRKDVYE